MIVSLWTSYMRSMTDTARLDEALEPVLSVVRAIDPSDPEARAKLEAELPYDSPAVAALREIVREGDLVGRGLVTVRPCGQPTIGADDRPAVVPLREARVDQQEEPHPTPPAHLVVAADEGDRRRAQERADVAEPVRPPALPVVLVRAAGGVRGRRAATLGGLGGRAGLLAVEVVADVQDGVGRAPRQLSCHPGQRER